MAGNNTRIPPPPVTSEDKTIWNNWYIAVKDAINNLRAGLTWSNLDFTGSNITNIITRNHNDLNSINGGSSTERYHLTSAQYNDLTDGGTTTLHSHVLSGSATLDFPSIASNSTAELTLTVTGAQAGKSVMLGPPAAIEAGLIWCGYVSATNTVTIRIYNMSGGAVDPASATWNARVEI